MEVSKRRLIRQLLQSATPGGAMIDREAKDVLFSMRLIMWRDPLSELTIPTEDGERLLQELEATWENQT